MSLGNSSRVRIPSLVNNNNNYSIFKECLKNHAVSHGGHSLDGCCEFLPVGSDGSPDALICAVCSCHRNFHRMEAPPPSNINSIGAIVPATIIPAGEAYPPYNRRRLQTLPPPQNAVNASDPALTLASGGGSGGEDHSDVNNIDNGGAGVGH